MEEINKKPTFEIINELSRLEQEIGLKTLKYNILVSELVRRFPFLANDEQFMEKEILTKQKIK